MQKLKQLSDRLDRIPGKLLCGLWDVGKTGHALPNSKYNTKGWSEHIIGQSHSSVFPHGVNYDKNGNVVDMFTHTHKCENGTATMNFHNMMHIDNRNKGVASHCRFLPTWAMKNAALQSNHGLHYFQIGNKLFDISNIDMTISWLPGQNVHSTSKPLLAPPYPGFLEGDKCINTVYRN